MKKSNTAKKHADEYDDDFSDYTDDYLDDDLPTPDEKQIEQTVSSQAIAIRIRNRMRRAQSEAEARSIVPWHLEDGYAYHCISSGDVDFQTYMRIIVESHRLDYCLFSTWVMAMDDVDEFAMWIDKGYVGRMDAYVGENFIQHYQTILQKLDSIIERGGGRVSMNRNHSKVFVGYWRSEGQWHAAVIESSANINTNQRIEQACITIDLALADFYKGFYDSLRPMFEWPHPWEPWRHD